MGRTDFKYSIWSIETSSPLIPFITFTPSYPILPFLLNRIEEVGRREGAQAKDTSPSPNPHTLALRHALENRASSSTLVGKERPIHIRV
jgi:hypothetical protein